MLKKKGTNIRKTFIRQQDQSDCGVACLASLLAYYGGSAPLEKIREVSGTTKQGTSLLGLLQAAERNGFEAEGFEADLSSLKDISSPVILHLIIDKHLQHYVVCYGWRRNIKFPNKSYFLIGDPANGFSNYSESELIQKWQSKALLMLTPNDKFITNEQINLKKKLWFLDLIKADTDLLAISTVIGIIVAVLGMSTAIFLQRLIDKILPAADTKKLIFGTITLAALLVARSGLIYFRGLFMVKQSFDLNTRLSNQFLCKILRLPKSFFDSRKTGEFVARLNDVRRIQTTVSNLTSNLTIDLLTAIITAIFIINYSISIGTFIILTSFPYMILTTLSKDKIINSQRDGMVFYAKNESNYLSTIQGISTIKSDNREGYFEHLSLLIYSSFQEKLANLGRLILHFNLYSDSITSGIIFVSICWASWLVLHKTMQLGEMVAIITMITTFISSVSRLSVANFQIQEAVIAFDRMFEFANVEPEYKIDEERAKKFQEKSLEFNELLIKNINFRFAGRSLLLNDVSLKLTRGRMVSLIGESGCGKSTIIQIIQRFYGIESGEILLNGENWFNTSTFNWRELVGVVSQDITLFTGTVVDNIAFGNANASSNEIISFCSKYGFNSFFENLPQGYTTLLGESGVNISGGQKQLLALARALYRRPQLLLLDEATSALDFDTEHFVIELLLKIKREYNICILLITHKARLTKFSDYIYVLDNKTVAIEGSHEELMSKENLYQRFLLNN